MRAQKVFFLIPQVKGFTYCSERNLCCSESCMNSGGTVHFSMPQSQIWSCLGTHVFIQCLFVQPTSSSGGKQCIFGTRPLSHTSHNWLFVQHAVVATTVPSMLDTKVGWLGIYGSCRDRVTPLATGSSQWRRGFSEKQVRLLCCYFNLSLSSVLVFCSYIWTHPFLK